MNAEETLQAPNNITGSLNTETTKNADLIKSLVKDVENKDTDVYVFIYSTFCGHCKKAYAAWTEFAKSKDGKKNAGGNKIKVYAVDSTLFPPFGGNPFDDKIGESPEGFPTFRHIDIDGKIHEYNGERTPEAFAGWTDSSQQSGGCPSCGGSMSGGGRSKGKEGCSCGLFSGGKRRKSSKKSRKKKPVVGVLPKLKPVTMRKKKYHYRLDGPSHMRHKAINEGINYEVKHMGKTPKQAATAKKGRLNILRIYRRNKKVGECNKITKDMRYIDKKYKLGTSKNICGKSKKSKKSKKSRKTRKTRKTRKKSMKIKGGAQPRPPEPLSQPVMNDTMDRLQPLWIGSHLYSSYINEAFQIILDVDKMEAIYREGELGGGFFRDLILERFEIAIQDDPSNWDVIQRNMVYEEGGIERGRTGRVIAELRERNNMAADIYQENIIRIMRLNPDLRIVPPDRNDLSFGGMSRK
jgi:thiol-disulfide isomerase/thioredoxin